MNGPGLKPGAVFFLQDSGVLRRAVAAPAGGKNRVKFMLDGFNVFNTNTILSFSSNNKSNAAFTSPSSLVPPRVFRVGASISF